MFYRFSATPAQARREISGPGNSNSNSTSSTVYPAKRQRTGRACDRCRLHRIKCGEQRPCAHCMGNNAECITSHASARMAPVNYQGNTSSLSSASLPALAVESSRDLKDQDSHRSKDHDRNDATVYPGHLTDVNQFYPPSTTSNQQESLRTWESSPSNAYKEHSKTVPSGQASDLSRQSAILPLLGLDACLSAQLPVAPIPSGGHLLDPAVLPPSQRRYYLRLFWDFCNPFLQIISVQEFAELEASMSDKSSPRGALVDSMIALGMQHSYATGLAGRMLGLKQPNPRQTPLDLHSHDVGRPGFEHFHRCREQMRMDNEMSLDILRSHALMVLYLIKGNAFRDAYNLLGITVRKAYTVKLHRVPAASLPDAERTARARLWWMLFSMDLQCSLQLELPAACQKSLVKCPLPVEETLPRNSALDGHQNRSEENMNACKYPTQLASLAIIVTDISDYASTVDLTDGDGNSPAAIEHYARDLSSALGSLEIWHKQLPPELLSTRSETEPGDFETLGFYINLAQPSWLQRQSVLLELHYHNTYTLIQRPFIRLRHLHSHNTSGAVNFVDSEQSQVEIHIASALRHAITIVDIVFMVYSTSDLLYGWSEVLQALWNATLTIIASIYSNSQDTITPRALESLTRALTILQSFSPTCPGALAARDIIQSLENSLQQKISHGISTNTDDESVDWNLFTSLLEDQQASFSELDDTALSPESYSDNRFLASIASSSHHDTLAFSDPTAMLSHQL